MILCESYQTRKAPIIQVIPTIQGEGPYIGRPSLLIRFGGCPLRCKFCDTKWSYGFSDEHLILPYDLKLKIIEFNKYNIDTLMITGGEPFKYNEFLNVLTNSNGNIIKNIEFESNGYYIDDINEVLSNSSINCHINISPKLDPTIYPNNDITLQGILFKYRILNSILSKFNNHTYTFKFIYTGYKDDAKFLEYFDYIGIDKSHIMMMPLTPDRTKFKSEWTFLRKFRQSCINTIEFCLKHNIRYSAREHVFVFGDNKNEMI